MNEAKLLDSKTSNGPECNLRSPFFLCTKKVKPPKKSFPNIFPKKLTTNPKRPLYFFNYAINPFPSPQNTRLVGLNQKLHIFLINVAIIALLKSCDSKADFYRQVRILQRRKLSTTFTLFFQRFCQNNCRQETCNFLTTQSVW